MKISLDNIKNIIFDLGGVILEVEYNKLIDAFRELGAENFDKIYTKLKQDPLFDHFETGSITAAQFRQALRTKLSIDASDEEIDKYWGSMILSLPEERVEILRQLKENYRLFLLSNTNEIHVNTFTELIRKQHPGLNLEDLFEKTYYSNEIGMRKPDPVIFEYVLQENILKPEETLFIDDTAGHLEGAEKVGIKTYHLKEGDIAELFADCQ